MEINPAWLASTWFIDYDSDSVKAFADTAVGDVTEPVEIASRLFHAVRDGVRYDPWVADSEPDAYRASTIAVSDKNWCIPKSVLFVACARYKGIPARLGFADVRNHLTSEKLQATMGTDVFFWHGYAELLLNDHWAKLSTAFNIELCEKFGTRVLEFDPVNDSLMHPYDQSGNRHMEYVNQRGTYDDLPLDEILDTFVDVYGDWSKDENGNFQKVPDDTGLDEVFSSTSRP